MPDDAETLDFHSSSFDAHITKVEGICVRPELDLEANAKSVKSRGIQLFQCPIEWSKIDTLTAEVESLKKDKENLRINLFKAEEEVKVLAEENRLVDEENKRLVRQLHRERHHQGSESKLSASASSKGKHKSSIKEESPARKLFDINSSDSPRQPLSPMLQNSPDSIKMHKK